MVAQKDCMTYKEALHYKEVYPPLSPMWKAACDVVSGHENEMHIRRMNEEHQRNKMNRMLQQSRKGDELPSGV